MPTYEYECDNCREHLEKFQSIKDAPLKKCPKCGKDKLKRLIGAGAGIIFKGNGFYCTDYRSDNYNKAKQKDNSVATSTDSGGSGKKDSAATAAKTKKESN